MELEQGDLVLCTVERIEKTIVFVKVLVGNEEIDGSIITSEIAPGRIRNIRDYVVPKKRIVCKVLRISQNKNIELSKTEYALLEYLIRHKGKVLTKDQIINHVWDYDADVLPNTVEVYIGYLRNKIDKPYPNEKPLIHTVRGFGYKIEGN